MIFVMVWDWFVDKAESWGPADLAMMVIALGVAAFLVLAGWALVFWSVS